MLLFKPACWPCAATTKGTGTALTSAELVVKCLESMYSSRLWQPQLVDLTPDMAAARHASVSKLMLLCERHPRRLIPGMLTLLACLPETVTADFYSHLLTLVSCLLMSAFCLVGVTVRATCSLSHRRVGAFDAVSMPRSPQSLQSLFAGLATPRLLKVYGAIHCQLAAAAESKERRAYHGTIP